MLTNLLYCPLTLTQKSLSTAGLNKQQQQKKSPAEKKGKNKGAGILVNKNEQQPAAKAIVAEPNHFEEILPKDDVEMLKIQVNIYSDI